MEGETGRKSRFWGTLSSIWGSSVWREPSSDLVLATQVWRQAWDMVGLKGPGRAGLAWRAQGVRGWALGGRGEEKTEAVGGLSGQAGLGLSDRPESTHRAGTEVATSC